MRTWREVGNFAWHRGVRQIVQPHTFCAPLLVFEKTIAQPHFADVQ